jgi:hypothetical protein
MKAAANDPSPFRHGLRNAPTVIDCRTVIDCSYAVLE